MADVLIVLGDRRRVAAAQVNVDNAQVRWTGGWTSPWPEGMSPGQNPQGAGQWLKAQWSAAGLTAKSAWVVMSREDIVLRHLELPAAPDEELADMVRFQAAARSAIPIDQACLDFLPLPSIASRPGRDVLSATIANSAVEGYRAILHAADRDLAGVTFSSVALAEWTIRHSRRREAEAGRGELSRSGAHALMASLTRRTTDPNHAELTVVVDGAKVELVVVAERQLVFGHLARSMSVPEEERQVPIQAEVSRTLVAAERLRPELKLHHVWLVGGNAALAKSLQEQVGCPVELTETVRHTELGECPAALRDAPADVVLLTGAALARSFGAAPSIDFVHPRQPPPKRDPRKQKIAVGAAAALLGAFVILGSGQMWLRSLNLQIAALQTKQIDLDTKIRGGQRELKASDAIAAWEVRNISQLSQFGELEQTLPGGLQRPYLSQYQFNFAKGDVLAAIKMNGAARSRADVEDFKQELVDKQKYRVKPSAITASRDDDYPSGFQIEADVVPVRQKPAAAVAPTKK
jgi:hypothetical protein